MYPPGSVLDGKYRVERQLGSGGMGVVIAAEHMVLRTPVALKFLAERYTERADVVERFMREARASAGLRSEHVCRVSDVGRLPSGVPYIVMELLEGKDLAALIDQVKTLPVSTAADLVVQACDAIAEAHAMGIVHRDLKPANLFLAHRKDGRSILKVLDFGVAKADSVSQPSLTQTENVVGSPTYMSPEALRSAKQADARSDIWSLGVILYELVHGVPPFTGINIGDLAINIATEPLVQKPSSSPELDRVIAKCLEKDGKDRYQTAAQLAAALAPIADTRPRTPDPDARPAPAIRAVLDDRTPFDPNEGVPTDILEKPPRIMTARYGVPAPPPMLEPRPSNELTAVVPPIVTTPTPPTTVAPPPVPVVAASSGPLPLMSSSSGPRALPIERPRLSSVGPELAPKQMRWGRVAIAAACVVAIAVAIAIAVASTGSEVPATPRPVVKTPVDAAEASSPADAAVMPMESVDAAVTVPSDAAEAPADATVEETVAPDAGVPTKKKKKHPKTGSGGDIGASRF